MSTNSCVHQHLNAGILCRGRGLLQRGGPQQEASDGTSFGLPCSAFSSTGRPARRDARGKYTGASGGCAAGATEQVGVLLTQPVIPDVEC